MGPERLFRNKAMARLKAIKNSWWESIQQKSIRGTPDIIGVVNGHFVAIEVKADNGRPSPLQREKLKRINEAGGVAVLLYPDGLETTLELLEALSVQIKP